MSEALGGSFRDGFIGGVAGAIGGGFAETHFDNTQSGILAKAAISAISGGTASVLTGGKFAQAAFSAGFFYLYNQLSSLGGRLAASKKGENVVAVYDGSAKKGTISIYSTEEQKWIENDTADAASLWEAARTFVAGSSPDPGRIIDISKAGWDYQLESFGKLDKILLSLHGNPGGAYVNHVKISPDGYVWRHIAHSLKDNGIAIMYACNCAKGNNGLQYLNALKASVSHYKPNIRVFGFDNFTQPGWSGFSGNIIEAK